MTKNEIKKHKIKYLDTSKNTQTFLLMNTPDLLKVAEIEITYKNHPDLLQRPKVESAKDVANIIRDVEAMQKNIDYKELFYAIYLNQNGRVLSVGKVSEGTAKYCLINTRQILQGALLQNSTGLIICHNHPSGSAAPSPEDVEATQRIKNAAMLLDIKLIDSIILTSYGHYSFADDGLI